jgi:hypothetical protein
MNAPQVGSLRKFCCLLCAILLSSSACVTTQQQASVAQLAGGPEGSSIVLMPLDVELYILTAGGLLEPQAAWTEAAQRHIATAIGKIDAERSLRFVEYHRPDPSESAATLLDELERLHGAVGQAILFHKYQVPLPTKKDVFDWTLGPDVAVLKQRTGADYALFLYIRDSYTSGGRILVALAAAFFGVPVSGGVQLGFASLVDLRTGNVVWFNHLVSTTGDLRTEAPADKTVHNLLDTLPD